MKDNQEQTDLEKTNEMTPQDEAEQTFCEETTYLDYLLSNAKDDTEKEHIKETINNYLDNISSEDDETTE